MTETLNLSKHQYLGDRAVVIGGSIAGLLSARVLADYFREVVIVDRDSLPEAAVERKGVPQSVQPHILLTKGYRVLQELFPGIEQDLATAGAIAIDWGREFYHFMQGGWMITSKLATPYVSVTCSRPLLEWVIRQQLTAISNIRFQGRSRVVGLAYDAVQQQISGVFMGRHPTDPVTTHLSAQFVVNASGRSSQAKRWLADIGFAAPSTTVIHPNLGYATRRYRVSNPGDIPWKVLLIHHEAPSQPCLGYLAKIEGDEWIATLGGYGQDYPPLDDSGFQAFARRLSNPAFYEFLQGAEPVSDLYAYRSTANRLHHYERVVLPHGFVTLGDALCALCPVYGQGMTVSAISALVLQDWLKGLLHSRQNRWRSVEFQKQLAQVIAPAWSLATGQDSRFETTVGAAKPHWSERLFMQYFDRLILKTRQDPQLRNLMIEVGHMLTSPSAFFHPGTVLRVMR